MPFQAQPTEKCTACARTVYQTERAVVEEKTEKKVYHKTCIRCATCNKVLEVGQIASMDGKIWCKPHFKQLFASKGNFDEAFGKEKVPAKTTVVNTPTSFVPETKSETKKDDTKQTSEATLARFRKFREEGDSDRCVSCAKTVYLAEKMLVEDKNEKRLFHKACFKCSVCSLVLDLRNYGSLDGKIYCKNHLKELGGLGKSASGNTFVSGNASFIPATQEEKKAEKSATPENIASKFKGIQGETEKCKECNKTVYATEKVTVPGKQGGLFHKTCFKCSVCSTKLDVTNYGSSNGRLFCNTHLKQFGKPEQAKGDNAYFVSPLAASDKSYTPGPREENVDEYDDRDEQRSQDSDNSSRQHNFRDSGRSSPAVERDSGRGSPALERKDSGRNSPAVDSGRSSPAIQRREPEPEPELEPQREPEPERTRTMSSSRSENGSRSDTGDDDQKRRDDERQRKREERQRQLEAEEREQEEERERRKRERERRLQESASDSSSSTNTESSNSKESEREERRKRREEERRREEEESVKEEEKRKKEREMRKREQEEEAAKELAEQEKKAEERKRRLAELKGEV